MRAIFRSPASSFRLAPPARATSSGEPGGRRMQRRHSISTPVWPYIAVVTCLFALSVLAPRLWRAGTQVGDSVRGETAPSRATRKLARDLRLEDQLVALGDFFAPRQTAAVAPPVARRHSHASTGAALPSPPEHELDLRLAYRSSLRPLTPQSESIPLVELPSSVAKASGHRSARCGCGMALSRCAHPTIGATRPACQRGDLGDRCERSH